MDARSRILAERLASRKTLFASLVARRENIPAARRELEIRRAELAADEKRLDEFALSVPAMLRALNSEIESMEASTLSAEDAEILALFGNVAPKLTPRTLPMHEFSPGMRARITQEKERDTRERSAK